MDAASVRCDKSWSPKVLDDLYFANGTALGRYLQFTPPPSLFSKHPGFLTEIQYFFSCKSRAIAGQFSLMSHVDNGTRAKEALSSKSFPRLYMVVFDPAYQLPEALTTGYAPLNLIDANGYTSVNLNLRVRHSPPAAPLYDYGKVYRSFRVKQASADRQMQI